MSFKNNLRKWRNRAKFSQESLADKMSVSRQTISKWENGDAYPSTKHILMLTKVLNCSMDELVDNEADNVRPDNVFYVASQPCKKYIYFVASAAMLLTMVFVFALFNFANYVTDKSAIDNSKTAIFERIIDGSLDETLAMDGYTKKRVIGYGIAEETGTFYIKCDLYDDGTGTPCSAIIYFCENDGSYSYECQYLDNSDYIPKGEYYKVG